MTHTVFIDGDQGTTGLQIVQRLEARPELRLLTLPERDRKRPQARAEALQACGVGILCLPDEAAREAVALLGEGPARVIDASSAHRVHPGWVYGLPELVPGQAARIAQAQRVSNPGCYPTGALALLRPLVDAGLLPRTYPLTIHAVSGYSGLGRAGVAAYETTPGSPAADAPALQVYGLQLEHKHLPEIQQHAGLERRPIFVPAVGRFRQGIVLTVPLHLDLLPPGTTGPRLHEALAAHHAGHPQVEVVGLAEAAVLQRLDPQALNGSDGMRLMVFHQPRQGQVLLAAVFDNLGKGAAGAAVQNLDLMLGLR
jgi:N-acetyl-gamma-glutamyl-phosphate reductase